MTLLSPLWLAIAMALAAAAFWVRNRLKDDSWHRVLSQPVLAYLRPPAAGRAFVHLPLLIAALAALAMASPAILKADSDAFRHASGWIVAVDVSRSMETDDIRPYRLAAARDAAAKLAVMAGSRPVALIVFAADAYLAVPFSFDKQQFSGIVQGVKPGLVPIEGSDPARALALAGSIIDDAGISQARVFLLSDASPSTIDALPAAAHLARNGHRLDVLTFGLSGSEGPVTTDPGAAASLAGAGGGVNIVSRPDGFLDLEQLAQTERWDFNSGLLPAPLTTNRYHNLSHWLLLLMVPLVLVLFRRPVA